MKWLLYIVNLLVPARWYIRHISLNPEDEISWFGPFPKRELEIRLDDDYADLLRYGGDELHSVKLSWLERREIPFIADAAYWEDQNDALCDDEPAVWEVDVESKYPERIYYYNSLVGKIYHFAWADVVQPEHLHEYVTKYPSDIYFYGPADLDHTGGY